MQGWLRSLPVFLTRPAHIVRHYRREDVIDSDGSQA